MFAKNLKYLREKYNLEQIELAEKLNRKSASSISEWEKGKYTPKIGTLNDIAEIFHVSITDLMNKDLSVLESSNNSLDINKVFNKLTEENKQDVYNYAEQKLAKQENEPTNKIAHLPKKDKEEVIDLAAHSEIDGRVYSKEEIKGIMEYLDQFIDE
ncbi:helix-turn-helix domain-containing protein [Enterococcus faecalis]|uniref:helix-turn-helix domain-containing protein n=1 Tax=Enterococcus faecalis TaxID=1351 RepID=UPI0018912962|nr:helix-turn-helix domain-containing protein [Enterococcus faecalis]